MSYKTTKIEKPQLKGMSLRSKSARVCVGGCPDRYGSSPESIDRVFDALEKKGIPTVQDDCTGTCNEAVVVIGAITNVLVTGSNENGETIRTRMVAGPQVDGTIGIIPTDKLVPQTV